MLTQKAIEECKKFYQEHFGDELSNPETQEQATKLINLVKAIYRPIPSTLNK